MTITMTLEEYELLKAERDRAAAQLNLWDKFLDSVDAKPEQLLSLVGLSTPVEKPLGSAIYEAFLAFKP